MSEAQTGSRPGSTNISWSSTVKWPSSDGGAYVWGDIRKRGFPVSILKSVDALTGEFIPTKGGVDYFADNMVFLRYHEIESELHRGIGILEKRSSDFERSLRKFEICEYDIKFGDPLTRLQNILSATPDGIDSERGAMGDD